MNKNRIAESAATYCDIDSLPIFLTVEEVALLLRTTKKSIYNMAERGQLPGATRIGIRLLISRDNLLQWLIERRTLSPKGERR